MSAHVKNMYTPGALKLLSYNVRGLNTPQKRTKILRELRAQRTMVAFLQETHFRGDSSSTLQDRYFPTGYFSSYTGGKSRGVAIILARDVPFKELGVQRDQNGRFLFLKGEIGGALYTFASIYLPNKGQYRSLSTILLKLSAFQEGTLVLAGDFNVALDPRCDTSTGTASLPPNIAGKMRRILDSYQLIDVWRALHGAEREYSYFSAVHSRYSRIDYIFIPQHSFDAVCTSDIHVKTWSDHSPVSVDIISPLHVPRERTWRLNLQLLTDLEVLESTRQVLTDYFRENLTEDISVTTVWEAHKTVVRGLLISKGTAAKKLRKTQLTELFNEVRRLEALHADSGAPSQYQHLLQARSSLTNHLSADLQFMALKTNSFFALNENKPGRLLAQILKTRRTRSYIPRIQLAPGTVTTNPDLIAKSFQTYFSSLYSIQDTHYSDLELDDIKAYLADKALPSLAPAEAIALGSPIQMVELVEAIKRAKPRKCPGPDGLPTEYYKLLQAELLPHMLASFNTILEDKKFHTSSLTAVISLIPKPDKDPLHPSSYRPISLLNSDVKLLARILATRLQHYLPRLVDPDQVGFIPGREAKDATTRVINAVLLAKRNRSPFLLLSTDAEKAFDRVLWPYLMQVLQKFGLGKGFLSWISALYTAPTARVRVNGALTQSFPISNGTRQGCPLSPLLFALSLEPLLASIRTNEGIEGLQGKAHCHKVAAYADDLMFLLTNPVKSLPVVVRELHKFGTLAGLAINEEKSEILNISATRPEQLTLKSQFTFRWCTDKLKYLGIWLCADVPRITKLNYDSLLMAIQKDLSLWSPKYISWFGRVGVLKMNALPRILYLLQTIPLNLPAHFIHAFRKSFVEFIWAGSRPRLQFAVMCRPKSQGGLALPDIRLYYYASQLTRILDWMSPTSTKRWLDLETKLASIPLWAMPWLIPGHLPPSYKTTPTLAGTVSIWHRLRIRYSLASFPSPLLPLSHNPGLAGGVRSQLKDRFTTHPGLLAMHVLADGQFKQIPPSDEGVSLTLLDSFNYQQIKHFLKSLPNGTSLTRPLTAFETYCALGLALSRSLSTLYRQLQSSNTDLPTYVGKWDTLLDTVIPETHWSKALDLLHRSTPITKLKETSYKILTMWYSTPVWLANVSRIYTTTCWRCNREMGTYLHIWWSCSLLVPFWKAAQTLILRTTDVDLAMKPEIFLLGQLAMPVKHLKKSVLLKILLAARFLIPVHWNSSTTPTARALVDRIELIRSHEMTSVAPEQWAEVHNTTWFHWDTFISSIEFRQWLEQT
uniref:Reverse transcriptase domain-containing protein n=1 Tax=Leptobrachium leishanense TaxID=445787 RepID=A0A8C5PIJ7_9ANUR